MKDGYCPMCKSKNVYRNPDASVRAGSNIVDLDDTADLVPYVCRSCGFTAFYIEDKEQLEDLLGENGWEKVRE
jgi:predicted nucleic-acid-binding Zn-ribbon protein